MSTPAVTVELNTISKRSPDVTGILKPEVNPLAMVPRASTPVKPGLKVTVAPGTAVKILFGVEELNKRAVIVKVDAAKVSAAVVLKYAAKEVIVPARGTENAKFNNVPAAPVRSIVPPRTDTLDTLLPKPTKPEVFKVPPSTVVKATGSPEA